MKLKEILQKYRYSQSGKEKQLLEEAMDFVSKEMGISKEEALENIVYFLLNHRTLEDRIAWRLYRKYDPDDIKAWLVHEAVEASMLKKIWGKIVLRPREVSVEEWKKTPYYTRTHPVAVEKEMKFLREMGRGLDEAKGNTSES